MHPVKINNITAHCTVAAVSGYNLYRLILENYKKKYFLVIALFYRICLYHSRTVGYDQ